MEELDWILFELQQAYLFLNNWHHRLSLLPRGIRYKQKKKPRRHQRKKA